MTLSGLIDMFVNILQRIIPLLGAVAFLLFIYGVARFIRSSGSEKELKDSKNIIIWGIVGLFVLMSVWGIISFMKSELGFGSGVIIPQIKFK